MSHLLLYVVNRQLTVCFKSSKPVQIGLCLLVSSSIHGLHLDTHYGQTVATVKQWREDWLSTSVVNHAIVTDPTIQQPGFDLPHIWSAMNRFGTGQGPCHANFYRWGLAQSPCDCVQRQTMNHIVNTFPCCFLFLISNHASVLLTCLFLLELPYTHSWLELPTPTFSCFKVHVHYLQFMLWHTFLT